MARIVIDARLVNSSTGRYLQRLVQNLGDLKSVHEFTVLIGLNDDPKELKLPAHFTYINVDYPIGTFGEQLGLIRQLGSIKKDLVHFGMTQQPVLYRGKKVTTIHDLTTVYFRNPAKNRLVFWIKQRVYRWVVKIVARTSSHILVPSNFVKQQVVEFTKISPSDVTVTYEAADKIQAPAEPLKGARVKEFIMYVGRSQPHKNLDRLLEAFKLLKQSQPKLQLVFVGKKDGLYEKLEKKVLKMGLEDVVFTGFVSDGQLRWLYENTAAYVFPSLSEGFGLPALEAMAHGAPVVSSNSSCLPEIYGDAALYFDPLQTVDIAAKVAGVLSDEDLAANLSKAGLKQAGNYSWRKMAEQTLETYNKVLNT